MMRRSFAYQLLALKRSLLAVVLLLVASACHKQGSVGPVVPQCETRADCDGGIAAGLICSGGKCQGCLHSSDCRLDEACDPVQRRCTLLPCFGDACTQHSDCTLGDYCVQGLCLAPGAASAHGCAVLLCGSDHDCNRGQRCNPKTFVCEEDLGCDPILAPCSIGKVCDTANGVCVPGCTVATQQQVCGPLVSCIDQRCIQCAHDSDCGPGLICDVATGQCAGTAECRSARDCPVLDSCDVPTGTCIATARPPCTSNESCANDERCSTSSGTCVSGACLPDRFSPNGTQATAAALSPGRYPQLTLCGAGQASWFSLALQSGEQVQVVSDADPLGSFDLQLLAPDSTVLAEGQLAVSATAGSDGTYFVRASSNDASMLYGLQIIERLGTACVQSPAGAHGQPAGAVPFASGSSGGFTLCAGEATWFVLRGSPDAGAPGVQADAVLDPTQGGPLVLTLFDSDAQTQLSQDATGSGALHVQAASATAGNFFLRVRGASATVTNSYDLTVRSLAP